MRLVSSQLSGPRALPFLRWLAQSLARTTALKNGAVDLGRAHHDKLAAQAADWGACQLLKVGGNSIRRHACRCFRVKEAHSGQGESDNLLNAFLSHPEEETLPWENATLVDHSCSWIQCSVSSPSVEALNQHSNWPLLP